MKKIIILILMLIPVVGYCQLYLRIDSLVIHDIIETEPEYVINEGFGEGPYVKGYFTFCNLTNDKIIINYDDNYKMDFFYEFEGRQYSSMYLYITKDLDSLVIPPMDSIHFDGGAIMMIDVVLHKSQHYIKDSIKYINHSEILKKIMPTLYGALTLPDGRAVKTPLYEWEFQVRQGRYGKEVIEYPINK